MTIEHEQGIVVPSNPEDRKKIQNMITEMTHSLCRIDGERDHNKEIANLIKSEYGIPASTVNKLAKTMYKNSYANLQSEQEDFETLYELLVKPISG